jgi:hypothetical protein
MIGHCQQLHFDFGTTTAFFSESKPDAPFTPSLLTAEAEQCVACVTADECPSDLGRQHPAAVLHGSV